MYFPEVCGVRDTWEFATWLWRKHGLLVAPGELFGVPGRIRLGYGGGTDGLVDGLERFAGAIKQFTSGAKNRDRHA